MSFLKFKREKIIAVDIGDIWTDMFLFFQQNIYVVRAQ